MTPKPCSAIVDNHSLRSPPTCVPLTQVLSQCKEVKAQISHHLYRHIYAAVAQCVSVYDLLGFVREEGVGRRWGGGHRWAQCVNPPNAMHTWRLPFRRDHWVGGGQFWLRGSFEAKGERVRDWRTSATPVGVTMTTPVLPRVSPSGSTHPHSLTEQRATLSDAERRPGDA